MILRPPPIGVICGLLWALAAAAATAGPIPSPADHPADPDLIPEARAILAYLDSEYGRGSLLGQNYGLKPARQFYEITGKWPALVGFDLSGFSWPRWGPAYREVLQSAVDDAKEWWTERGGLVTFQWHWMHPTATRSTWEPDPPFDLARAVVPATAEHDAVMRDLRNTADYLERLAKARVPVFFRPLHEINGGWFWWTDRARGENTAALWRMMFDYLVKERGLHNLIWVFCLAQGMGGEPRGEISPAYAFYPGDAYVDLVGTDVYAGGELNHRQNGWALFYGGMSGVFPRKLVALAECPSVPNPDAMRREAAYWAYCMAWWPPGPDNPPDWIKSVAGHEWFITLDELPDFKKARSEHGICDRPTGK